MFKRGLITLCFLLSVCAVNSQNYEGKLDNFQIEVLEGLFKWEKDDVLIINYRQPMNFCHYNQYRGVNSTKWFDDFYSKVELKSICNVFVYYESKMSKGIIDGKKHFFDLNEYLFKNFFNKDKSCYGLLIVNKNGNYQQKNGEYSQEEVLRLISKTKK